MAWQSGWLQTVHLGMGLLPSKKAAGFGFKVAKQSFAVSCVPKQELRHELKKGVSGSSGQGPGVSGQGSKGYGGRLQ
jgi:hypothetical protein